jgi:hypothetical protein
MTQRSHDANPPRPSASNCGNMFSVVHKLASTPTLALALLLAGAPSLRAQSSDPAADHALRAAVNSELHAAITDRSLWAYRDHDTAPGKDALYDTIETRQGELRRLIELNGHSLSASAAQAETQRINEYIHDPDAQARKRRAGAHDDAQATELLRMLPDAFLWTIASQDNEDITLNYRPNPSFDPPDMQARVMSIMAGQMIIDRHDNRIRTLRGHLTQDVLIGWGILGRLYSGGTFDIERRQVGGGHWQITESHVHIGGHALIFKTIGQQDDEVKTDWKPSHDDTLESAAQTLKAGR